MHLGVLNVGMLHPHPPPPLPEAFLPPCQQLGQPLAFECAALTSWLPSQKVSLSVPLSGVLTRVARGVKGPCQQMYGRWC